ncbi:sensor histidine kinase/response regulator [Aspergillus sclerotioniger CBS 115572]|uniref:Sensor histidine kinase/response regulator n=1 Tax=Aspergillus sclerotioniger CBS 115572 TaxID=1450535 RepID=A0A317XFM2_9EURO|nr:sensor histidine kinase/response regulator [Aspergillus sclerotioniger CBS 115572]PWY95908.1 sensor histidine kinase/response regulator [Aspergillus sclerotioniger CBS 115572]
MFNPINRLYSAQTPDRTDGLLRTASPASIVNGQKHSTMACPASDPTLIALAQLGTYRMGCKYAFVSLIDNCETHVIAEATPSGPGFGNKSVVNGNSVGMSTLGLARNGTGGACSPNVTRNSSGTIVRDLNLELDLKHHPLVERFRPRFYAEVPLHSYSGETIGTYCVVNDEPCHFFGDRELAELQDVANAVANHLQNNNALRHYRQNDRLLGGLMKFVKGQPCNETDGRKSRRKSTAASLISPRSSEVPEIDRLSVSAASIHEISPSSNRYPQPTPANESPFFANQAFGTVHSAPNGTHQRHVRKSSDETSNLVMVPEGTAISEKTSLLFSRASGILQECMDLDGVIFVDASRSNSRSNSTVSVADLDAFDRDSDSGFSLRSPSVSSYGGWSEKLCEPLGVASSQHPLGNSTSMFRLPLTEGLLHDMFTAFPQGEVLHPHQSVGSPPSSFLHQRRHSIHSIQGEHSLRHSINAKLAHNFPEAKSVVFLPLWNWNKSRWLAGTLVWTSDNQRRLGQDDLHFLKTFGDSIVSGFCQIDWTATEKAKSDLLSSVSHELRSPLHGMLASTELLQTTSLDSTQQDMVTMVETCGLTLLDTMNHLLEFTKINNLTHLHKKSGPNVDGMDNLLTEFDLDEVVEEVTDALYAGHRSLINAAKIAGRYLPGGSGVGNRPAGAPAPPNPDDLSVIVRIEDLGSWHLQSLSGAWRRIVMNILGNAFKFTRCGFIEVSLAKKVERSGYTKKTLAHLSITDTGSGISTDFLEHQLFKPFAQESILTEGVGLGLSVVKQLVNYLGGEIELKSDVGVGTQVNVYIPVEFVEENSFMDCGVPGARIMTRVSLVGLNAYADLKEAPSGLLSTEAKRKLALRGALSNVLLSQPGWMVSFADKLDMAPGDIAVIEESTLKKLSAKGPIDVKFRAIVVIGEQAVTLPGEFAIRGADVFYVPQPIAPRKVLQALQRITESHQGLGPGEDDPILGPLPGVPLRGRSLSDAFALAKGSESPPVVRENVSEFSPSMPREPTGDNLHVLIVDDNDINLKILATFLRKIGCTYETASNGLAAFEKYKNSTRPFDYILMDISMPIMDGIASSGKIREYEEQHSLPRAAIMAVTGVASSEMQQQAFAAGIDDYLVKPLSLHDLKRIMNIA